MISRSPIPFATRFRINDTVSRIPRMHARPPITFVGEGNPIKA